MWTIGYGHTKGVVEGQNNAISFGTVIEYETEPKLSCSIKESNVTFNVIKHDADTNNGSSGGMILNLNLELVGIHYAGAKDLYGIDFMGMLYLFQK